MTDGITISPYPGYVAPEPATFGIGLLAWQLCELAPGEASYEWYTDGFAFLVDTEYVEYAFHSGRVGIRE